MAKITAGTSGKASAQFKKATGFVNIDRKYVNKTTGAEKFKKLFGIPVHIDNGEHEKLIELLQDATEQDAKDILCHIIQQGRVTFNLTDDSDSEEDEWEAA